MKIGVKKRRIIAKYLNPFVEFFYRIKINNTSFKNAPVIIMTPGKVASSSIYSTLKESIKNPVYHIHLFSESTIEESIQDNLNSDRQYVPLHLIISKILRQKMEKYKGDIYLISLVREPVSRAISSFFQNSAYYKSEIEDNELKIRVDKAKEMLFKSLDGRICTLLEEWFDNEIKANFGIDVFNSNFDSNKKFIISRNKNFHHLLLRMEDVDQVFSNVIQEFLDLKEPIVLQKSNIAENKHYAEAYNEIKSEIKLPKEVLEEIIGSKYFQKFYKNKEAELIEKWSEN